MKKQRTKTRRKMVNSRGITMIALIITIIVLLILVGVSIAALSGDNGIINQTNSAKDLTNKSEALEKVQTEVLNSFGRDGNIDMEKLNENLSHIKDIKKLPITKLPAIVIVDGYEIQIEDNGEVSIKGETSEDNQKDQTVEDLKPGEGETITTVTENTTIKDDKGNQVVVPEGFGIAKDSATIVTDGIVIEDKEGNQFVWIPVGTIIKKDGTKTDIKLSRYTFDQDGTATEYGENIIDSYFQESTTSNKGNSVAKNIQNFKTSTNNNRGYYIGRYEASYRDGTKPYCKISTGTPNASSNPIFREGMLWNYVTQPKAATACKNMYTSNSFTSDLMNSYAWDTAIIFIQKFSGDTDYAWQEGKFTNPKVDNTGVNGDERCHIQDMACNLVEWTTETSNFSYGPCVQRGGSYNDSNYHTSYRSSYTATDSFTYNGFRPLLYIGS